MSGIIWIDLVFCFGSSLIINMSFQRAYNNKYCSQTGRRHFIFLLLSRVPGYDGLVSERLIISTSRCHRCRSAASRRASSACCRSSPCSASPPSWRDTRCRISTAGPGECTRGHTMQGHKPASLLHTCLIVLCVSLLGLCPNL